MGLACQVDDRYTRIDNSATCYGWFRIMDISHGQNSTVECASGLVVYEEGRKTWRLRGPFGFDEEDILFSSLVSGVEGYKDA